MVITENAVIGAATLVNVHFRDASDEDKMGLALIALSKSKGFKYVKPESVDALKAVFCLDKIRGEWFKLDSTGQQRIDRAHIESCLQKGEWAQSLGIFKDSLTRNKQMQTWEDPAQLANAVESYKKEAAAVQQQTPQHQKRSANSPSESDNKRQRLDPVSGGAPAAASADDDGRWIRVKDWVTDKDTTIHHNKQGRLAGAIKELLEGLGCDQTRDEAGAFAAYAMLKLGCTISKAGKHVLQVPLERDTADPEWHAETVQKATGSEFGKKWDIQCVPCGIIGLDSFNDLHLVERES
eukprot:TRINITY_DN727_c0_g1_i3.p1 TRINITY_DN727_c0_g1~~TRINITY_DN727_c0_g1_i3.p1  ORF type:complete len:295 (-),score=65.07 TRINITY_DN727_c0_g1_i3:291-1175(-)